MHPCIIRAARSARRITTLLAFSALACEGAESVESAESAEAEALEAESAEAEAAEAEALEAESAEAEAAEADALEVEALEAEALEAEALEALEAEALDRDAEDDAGNEPALEVTSETPKLFGKCGDTFDPCVGPWFAKRACAYWTVICSGGGVELKGWVQDLQNDGRCYCVRAEFSDGDVEYSPKVCRRGVKMHFNLRGRGQSALGYLQEC